jgi:DNA-binding NarL/FixJ family response regulator/multidrug resistance efflux pump
MIRILLVDDQKSVRERLRTLLSLEPDMEVVGVVDNGYDAIEQVKALLPDVVLMDMEMPDIDGILTTKIINHSYPDIKVLVLSSHDTNEYVAKSIYAGAKGYLLKGAMPQEIRDAIRFVYRGYMQIAPGLFEKFIPAMREATQEPSLSILQASSSSMGINLTEEPSALNFSAAESPVKITPLEDDRTENNPTIAPPEQIITPLQSGKLTRLTPNGSALQKNVPTGSLAPTSFDTPSELILDVTNLKTKRSMTWHQAAALMLASLGLTGGLFFLRRTWQEQSASIIPEATRQARLAEKPWQGKIDIANSRQVSASAPGVVEDVRVKVGQVVEAGTVLFVARNVEAERLQQEKELQLKQQELLRQQEIERARDRQLSQQQAAISQQQAQQQELNLQRQQAQQRIAELQAQIATYRQTIAPLQARLAAANYESSAAGTRAEAPIAQKESAIVAARAVLDRNQTELASLETLYNSGAISRDRVDKMQAEVRIAKAALDSAMADLAQTRAAAARAGEREIAQLRRERLQQQVALKEQSQKLAQLEQSLRQAQLDSEQLTTRMANVRRQPLPPVETLPPIAAASPLPATNSVPTRINVTAPTSGIVTELPVQAGAWVSLGGKLATIGDRDSWKIQVTVTEGYGSLLNIGQRALIKLNATGDQELTGSITKLEPSADNRQTTVEVTFTGRANEVLLGKIATVYFPHPQK